MIKPYLSLPFIFLLSVIIITFACNGQHQSTLPQNDADHINTTPTVSIKQTKAGAHLTRFDIGYNIWCGFVDTKGVLWFGTNKGAFRYDGDAFTNYSIKDGLAHQYVRSIMEDQDHNIWFGTPQGLSRFDGKQFTTIPIPQQDTSTVWLDKVYPIVNPNEVTAMVQDDHGDFWIGTNGAGAYHYDGKSFTPYLTNIGSNYEDGLQHNIIQSIIKDKEGNIWFASMSHGGINRYNGTNFTQFMPKDGLSDDFYRTCFQDSKGNYWFGSNGNRNGGLDRYDGTNFTHFYKKEDGLANNNYQAIYEDQLGQLWIGSGVDTLSIFDGEHFKPFKTKEGKSFTSNICIIGDADGHIWFSERNGILYRYKPHL